jgi:glyoxylate carboligase
MARIKASEAAVHELARQGVTVAFAVPAAATAHSIALTILLRILVAVQRYVVPRIIPVVGGHP